MVTVRPTQREIKERCVCVSQSVHDYLCVCDVSIKGNKADHEVNVWSLSDTDISNGWLTGNLYCEHREVNVS